jgi:hypothetical protein
VKGIRFGFDRRAPAADKGLIVMPAVAVAQPGLPRRLDLAGLTTMLDEIDVPFRPERTMSW